jgi:hypothetical protein
MAYLQESLWTRGVRVFVIAEYQDRMVANSACDALTWINNFASQFNISHYGKCANSHLNGTWP